MKNLILLFLIVLLASCQKIPCEKPGVHYQFENYDSASLAIFIVRKYAATGDFSTLLQTRVSGTSIAASNGDTMYNDHTLAYYIIYVLDYNYDYQIEVSATGQLFKIKGFSVIKRSLNRVFATSEPPVCVDGISYYINDTLKTFGGVDDVSNTVGGAIIKLNK